MEFKNLVELQEHACKQFKDRPLYGTKVGSHFEWTTFRQFGELVDQMRGGLASLGVQPGDTVAIISANRLEWAVAAYATYSLGGVFVPLYESQLPKEWEYILNDAGAKVVFVSNEQIYQDNLPFKKSIESVETIVPLENVPGVTPTYASLLETGKTKAVPSQSPDREAPYGMVYTSGTTGNPKGVLHSHQNVMFMLNKVLECVDITAEDRSLSFLPWAHIFGQLAEVHMLFLQGSSTALVKDVNDLLDDLKTVQPTLFFAVPRLYNKIYDGVQAKMLHAPAPIRHLFNAGMERANKKRTLGALGLKDTIILTLADRVIFKKIRAGLGGNMRFAVTGASALNPEIYKFILNLGIQLAEGYGATETTGALTISGGLRPLRLGSVGKAVPGVTIKIDRSLGSDNSDDGEVIGYGPGIMLGYHNSEELTKGVFTEDGGYRSGDLGRLDSDGFLYITGRVKEQYKLENGKFVSPVKTEESLKLSPYISQAMLYGLNRPYNVVVLGAEAAEVNRYLQEKQIQVRESDWNSSPEVRSLFQKEIDKLTRHGKSYEKPKNFLVVPEEWNTENGILTPTMKLKRRVVLERYQDQINLLYAN